ncbi:MAG: hypothetical protein A3J83_02265 [Elusimicrobia bacterium RIFOXYA2_FULL_40_6]|nr:MAG: hypothetical protein A3J83_02265 [Elusimicrobia bacterium RIFOXYA2_FULL_40_6]
MKKKYVVLSIAIALISLYAAYFYGHGNDGTYKIKDGAGYYRNNSGRFEMKISYDTAGKAYIIDMTAKANGWISVGFGRTKMMKDAEIFMGYVKDGKGYLSHEYGVGVVKHKPIKELDSSIKNDLITIVSAKEENGITKIVVKRPIEAAGKYYKKFESGKKMEFMYGISNKDDITVKHAERGAFDIVLP